ncbi:hypothetical protein HispidOSU_029637, partial [Sigmodon hispidus]
TKTSHGFCKCALKANLLFKACQAENKENQNGEGNTGCQIWPPQQSQLRLTCSITIDSGSLSPFWEFVSQTPLRGQLILSLHNFTVESQIATILLCQPDTTLTIWKKSLDSGGTLQRTESNVGAGDSAAEMHYDTVIEGIQALFLNQNSIHY